MIFGNLQPQWFEYFFSKSFMWDLKEDHNNGDFKDYYWCMLRGDQIGNCFEVLTSEKVLWIAPKYWMFYL